MQNYVATNSRRPPSGYRTVQADMCWITDGDDDANNHRGRRSRQQVQSVVPYKSTSTQLIVGRSPERRYVENNIAGSSHHVRGRSKSVTRVVRATCRSRSRSRSRVVLGDSRPTIVVVEETVSHVDQSKHKHSRRRRRHHRKHRHHSTERKSLDISYHRSREYTAIESGAVAVVPAVEYGNYHHHNYDSQIRIAHATPPPDSPYVSTDYGELVTGYPHYVSTTGPGEENRARGTSRSRHFVASASISTGPNGHISLHAARVHDVPHPAPEVRPRVMHEEVYIAQPGNSHSRSSSRQRYHHHHHQYQHHQSTRSSSDVIDSNPEFVPLARISGRELLRQDGRGHHSGKMRYGGEHPYRPRSPMRMQQPRAPSPGGYASRGRESESGSSGSEDESSVRGFTTDDEDDRSEGYDDYAGEDDVESVGEGWSAKERRRMMKMRRKDGERGLRGILKT